MDPQSGPPQTDVLIGQTVGNYQVTQKLGEGGMGAVYLAEHPTIGKKVALKVLHPEFSSNPEVAERFFTEAKAVNAIGHPNIVDIVDYGVIQAAGGRDRMVYFIMEYLSGLTLSQVIRDESPLSPERSLTIALQVADALAASHKTGIVHRDLKPDNIILIRRGREQDFVKLLDFGIAKLTGGDGVSSHKTRTGLVLGTPAYMSPEQCEGKPNVDHRTDVYALGIVLYEMLTGRVPFIGEGYGDILVQHLTQRPVEPSQYRMMSPHVEQVVLKALEKNPAQRYPTMDEFTRALADPVSFVEAHGGIGGFAQRQLMPSSAPLPPVRLTTPLPDMRSGPVGAGGAPNLLSPVPGTLTPVPTTLGAAAGELEKPARNKTGFVIGGAVVAVIAGIAVFFVIKGGDKSSTGAGSGSVASGSDGSAIATGADKGSAAVKTVETRGSAADTKAGSGAGSSTSVAAGSASVKTPPVTPEATEISLEIKSEPAGAEIFYNGGDTNQRTPATMHYPIKHEKGEFRLKLRGYDDYVFKDVSLDKDQHESATLKKAVVAAPHGHGSGPGSGKPNNSGGHSNDTGLMVPE
jgi:serine/threonine-protein kinase